MGTQSRDFGTEDLEEMALDDEKYSSKQYYLFEFPQEVDHYLQTGDSSAALTNVRARWMHQELRDLMKEYSTRYYTFNPLYLADYETQKTLLVKLKTVTELVLDEVVEVSLG